MKSNLLQFVEDLNKYVKDEEASVAILANSADIQDWLSTGNVVLDYILGGGLPAGRIVEIYGDESSGKSAIGAQVAAMAQQQECTVLYIDTEHAISKDILTAVGVDVDSILYTEPATIEQVFSLIEGATTIANKNGNKLLIIWDTIAATAAQAELDADFGSSGMGIHARLMSQGLRKINHLLSKSNVFTLFINQERDKIGVQWGDKTATFGGRAVAFYASVRIRLDKGSKIQDAAKKHIIGHSSRMKCIKNKVAPPFREASMYIYFGHGVDDPETTFEYLKEQELIAGGTGGNWSMFGGDLKFKKSNWKTTFEDNFDKIVDLIFGVTNG